MSDIQRHLADRERRKSAPSPPSPGMSLHLLSRRLHEHLDAHLALEGLAHFGLFRRRRFHVKSSLSSGYKDGYRPYSFYSVNIHDRLAPYTEGRSGDSDCVIGFSICDEEARLLTSPEKIEAYLDEKWDHAAGTIAFCIGKYPLTRWFLF